MTVTETQGMQGRVRGGLALAESAYKAGKTVPTGEWLPALSARNHHHRCFSLFNSNIDDISVVREYSPKLTGVVLKRTMYTNKVGFSPSELQNLYHWCRLDYDPLCSRRCIRFHFSHLPLSSFLDKPTQLRASFGDRQCKWPRKATQKKYNNIFQVWLKMRSIFFPRNYHRGWHTFLWGSGGNRRQVLNLIFLLYQYKS